MEIRKDSGNGYNNFEQKKIGVEKKIESGVYVPHKVLKKYDLQEKFKSVREATEQSMQRGTAPFGQAKTNTRENIITPDSVKDAKVFPKKSLTRLLTGDVKPEWIVGLGRMQKDKITPEEGYKDVFVSNLEEYERKGIHFDPKKSNNPVNMASKLDLKGDDLKKVEDNGAWLIEIHPSSKLATPSSRKSEWNPEYVEGGYTGSEQREWVTPNVGLDAEARAGRARIFKMDKEGKTLEWKFFQGKLLPDESLVNGRAVEGSWRHAIDSHVQSQAKKITPPHKPIASTPSC